MSREHFYFEDTFWHIYWDRIGFDVALLKKCEQALSAAPERGRINFRLHKTMIQPRSMKYIGEAIAKAKS